MSVRRLLRDTAFNLARRDVASFLADHEERLVAIFREEMADLDNRIPEEELFIDIHMVPLGEMILRAALHAITRFLLEDDASSPKAGQQLQVPVKSETGSGKVILKETRS
jgi:hypothetical protein